METQDNDGRIGGQGSSEARERKDDQEAGRRREEQEAARRRVLNPGSSTGERERALAFAAAYYEASYEKLPEEHPARQMLKERGIGEQTRKDLMAGYAPDEWRALSEAAREAGISDEAMRSAGLAREPSGGGKPFDALRGRIAVPITDEEGRLRGFGAQRVEGLERNTPALDRDYITSGKGPAFSRSEHVIGLEAARAAIERSRQAVVAETPLDMAALREAGFAGSVAVGGTYMSRRQSEIVAARADRAVVIAGDTGERRGDNAGVLVERGVETSVARLPEGYGADRFVAEHGPDALSEYVKGHRRTYAAHVMEEAQRAAARAAPHVGGVGGERTYEGPEGAWPNAGARVGAAERLLEKVERVPAGRQAALFEEVVEATRPRGSGPKGNLTTEEEATHRAVMQAALRGRLGGREEGVSRELREKLEGQALSSHEGAIRRDAYYAELVRRTPEVEQSIRDVRDILGPGQKPTPEDALAFAADYYAERLRRLEADHPARAYLDERGVSEKARERFGLGYAPDEWRGLVEAGEAVGIDGETLEKAGLAHYGESRGRHFDAFRGRVTFPITDEAGEVKGFGARRLDALERNTPDYSGEPKYVNSRDSEYFDKGRELYGHAQARDAIARTGEVVVTEGYLDAVALSEHGYENVVATKGTALTERQAKTLTAAAEDITLMFDGDRAGREASMRAARRVVEAGGTPYVVPLPEGQDPDTLARTLGRDGLRAHIEEERRHFQEALLEGIRDRPVHEQIDRNKEAVRLASLAPTAELREAHFQKAIEMIRREEGPSHAYYLHDVMEKEFEQHLRDAGGLERLPPSARPAPPPKPETLVQPDGQTKRPTVQAAGQTPHVDGDDLEWLFGKPALDLKKVRAARQIESGVREQLQEAEHAFERRLREAYADERGIEAYRTNRHAHGRLVARESVTYPESYVGVAGVASPGPRTPDGVAAVRLMRAEGTLAKAEERVRAAEINAGRASVLTDNEWNHADGQRARTTRERSQEGSTSPAYEQGGGAGERGSALREDRRGENERVGAGAAEAAVGGDGAPRARREDLGRAAADDKGGFGAGTAPSIGRGAAEGDGAPAERERVAQDGDERLARAARTSSREDGGRDERASRGPEREGRHSRRGGEAGEGGGVERDRTRSREEDRGRGRQGGDAAGRGAGDSDGARRGTAQGDGRPHHEADQVPDRSEPGGRTADRQAEPAAGVRHGGDANAGGDRRGDRRGTAAHRSQPDGPAVEAGQSQKAPGGRVGEEERGGARGADESRRATFDREPASRTAEDAASGYERARADVEAERLWSAASATLVREEAVRRKARLDEVNVSGLSAEEIEREAARARQRFSEKLGEVYRNPDKALEKFERLYAKEGFVGALEKAYDDPGRLGHLHGHRNVLGWTNDSFDRAWEASETLHRYASNHLGHAAAKKTLLEAQSATAQREALQPAYFEAKVHADEAFANAYRNPEEARATFEEAVGTSAPGTARYDAAAEKLRDDPGNFGMLRGGQAGWVEDATREGAMAWAALAAEKHAAERTAKWELDRIRMPVELAEEELAYYRAEYERVAGSLREEPAQERAEDRLKQALRDAAPETVARVAYESEEVQAYASRAAEAGEHLDTRRAAAVEASRGTDEVFARIYADPAAARAAYEEAGGFDPASERYEAAQKMLRTEPHEFGELRDGVAGPDLKPVVAEAATSHEGYARASHEAAAAREEFVEAQAALRAELGQAAAGGGAGGGVAQQGAGAVQGTATAVVGTLGKQAGRGLDGEAQSITGEHGLGQAAKGLAGKIPSASPQLMAQRLGSAATRQARKAMGIDRDF